MSISQHVGIVRSSAALIIVTTLVAAVVAAGVSLSLPRTYQAAATLHVGQSLGDSEVDYSGLLASQFVAQTYARLATGRPILEATISELDLAMSPEQLIEQLAVTLPPDGTLITVTSEAEQPELAAAIANTVAAQLLAQAPTVDPDESGERRARIEALDAVIAAEEAAYVALLELDPRTPAQDREVVERESRLSTLIATKEALLDELPGVATNALAIVEAAAPPLEASGPSPVLVVAAATAAALIAAVGVAYVAYAWRESA